jgi:hypothetical protein
MYFVNFHYGSVSIHARRPPQILSGNGDAAAPALIEVQAAELAQDVRGKHVLFVTHGFNVTYAEGVRSLARFAASLALPPNVKVVPVLWPGDFYVRGINYPIASVAAIDSGRGLAALCNGALAGKALGFSFMSHSLGARVVLEAVAGLAGRARMLCITAGAVNDDCLSPGGEYAAVAAKADHIYNLASLEDEVLRLAYPVGNLIGWIFAPHHGAFQQALGRGGPRPPALPPTDPHQIPDVQAYDHGNYLASSQTHAPVPAPPPTLDDTNKWQRVSAFVSQAYTAAIAPWPPPA